MFVFFSCKHGRALQQREGWGQHAQECLKRGQLQHLLLWENHSRCKLHLVPHNYFGGPEDRRAKKTRRPEDQKTRGPRDRRTRGPRDQRTGRPEDQKTTGPEDQRTAGPEDQKTGGPEDRRSRDRRTRTTGPRKPEDQRTRRPEDQRTTGPEDPTPSHTQGRATPLKKKTGTPTGGLKS